MEPKEIFAIEKDKKLFSYLNNKFENYQNIKIYNEDALEFIKKKTNIQKNIIVFGNLPYNISNQIKMKSSTWAVHRICKAFLFSPSAVWPLTRFCYFNKCANQRGNARGVQGTELCEVYPRP